MIQSVLPFLSQILLVFVNNYMQPAKLDFCYLGQLWLQTTVQQLKKAYFYDNFKTKTFKDSAACYYQWLKCEGAHQREAQSSPPKRCCCWRSFTSWFCHETGIVLFQGHKIIEWLRWERTFGNCLLQPPAQSRVSQTCLQGWSGWPVPVPGRTHSEKDVSYGFVPIASCPLAGHHWEESGSVFPPLPSVIYMHW